MTPIAMADVNGVRTRLEEARVPVTDRGFLYGDAVYEVIRVMSGLPFHLEEHLDRLESSARGLRLSGLPPRTEWHHRCRALLEESGVRDGALYLQVTRGDTGSRMGFPAAGVPLTVVLFVEPRNPYPDSLYANGVSVVTRQEERWLRADLKTVNLIPRILAKQDASAAGGWEVIWVSSEGEVLEGGSTNVFAVMGKELVTPPLGERILAGVTRGLVLSAAAQTGLRAVERALSLEEWMAADEVFLTGTTTEVLGVSHTDGTCHGSGVPGPCTVALRGLLLDAMRNHVAAFRWR